MFRTLIDMPKPSLENLEPVNCNDTQQTPATPPMRFGAIQIPITPDPDQSVITITEFPNANNTNDYHIVINGAIRSGSDYYAEFLTLVNTLTDKSAVTIWISSPGGSLYTGAMIANSVKNSKASVTAIACGIVASAAALIWSHAQHREVKDNAVILFHMSSHMDWGNSEKIKITAENVVRYVKEICIDPMVEQGIITLDEAELIIDKRRDLLIDAATMKVRLEKFHEQA